VEAEREALNKTRALTELELRCVKASLKAEPAPLPNWFDVIGLTATPGPKGLSVVVDLRRKEGVKLTRANAAGVLNDSIYFHVRGYVRKHICRIRDDFRNASIVVRIGGRPVAKRDGSGFAMLMKP